MHLHQIAIQIGSQRETLNAREVTPAGLHGVFYDVVKRVDPSAATWLHEHRAPKPYTLAPAHFDRQRRELAGILVSTLSDESAELITTAFHHVYQQQTQLHIGKQACHVADLIPLDNTSFAQLSHSDPVKKISLEFLTPTSFSQRQGELLFPIPYNVFKRPFEVWQTYSPEAYQLPTDWLEWCENNVFVTRHEVRSVQKNINRHKRFAGFVGKARFEVRVPREMDEQRKRLYCSVFNALGRFATFSGIGRKTTMGMGAVEIVQ